MKPQVNNTLFAMTRASWMRHISWTRFEIYFAPMCFFPKECILLKLGGEIQLLFKCLTCRTPCLWACRLFSSQTTKRGDLPHCILDPRPSQVNLLQPLGTIVPPSHIFYILKLSIHKLVCFDHFFQFDMFVKQFYNLSALTSAFEKDTN